MGRYSRGNDVCVKMIGINVIHMSNMSKGTEQDVVELFSIQFVCAHKTVNYKAA